MSTEIRVRYNPVLGSLFVAAGIGFVIYDVLLGNGAVAVTTGVLMMGVGVLYATGTMVIVTPGYVEVKSPFRTTVNTVAIKGLRQLVLDGDRLATRSGTKIANLGMGACRRSDIEALRTVLAAAR